MADDPAMVERGVLTAPAEAWDLAVRRAEVIGQLAGQRAVGLEAADAAADRLGVSRRQVYVLVRRWRAGEGLASDLLPGTSSGGRGGGRLPDEVESVIQRALRTRYLTRQRRPVAAVCRDIARECRVSRSAGAVAGNGAAPYREAGPVAGEVCKGRPQCRAVAAFGWRHPAGGG
jgi:putative transposase